LKLPSAFWVGWDKEMGQLASNKQNATATAICQTWVAHLRWFGTLPEKKKQTATTTAIR
jgi:hypothetical protein